MPGHQTVEAVVMLRVRMEDGSEVPMEFPGGELVVGQVVHQHGDDWVDLVLGLQQVIRSLVRAGHMLVKHLIVVNIGHIVSDPPLAQNYIILQPSGLNLEDGWGGCRLAEPSS